MFVIKINETHIARALCIETRSSSFILLLLLLLHRKDSDSTRSPPRNPSNLHMHTLFFHSVIILFILVPFFFRVVLVVVVRGQGHKHYKVCLRVVGGDGIVLRRRHSGVSCFVARSHGFRCNPR